MAYVDPVPIRSARDAEHIACVHLQALGFSDARLTPRGRDGGVDVRGSGIVAQVKAEVSPVGVQVCQALFGVAASEDVTGAVFALAGFTPAAKSFADKAGLALFRFDLMGAAEPLNLHARSLSGRSKLARRVEFLLSMAAEQKVLHIPDGHVALVVEVPEEALCWVTEVAVRAAGPEGRVRLVSAPENVVDVQVALCSLVEGEVLAVGDAERWPSSSLDALLVALRDRRVDCLIEGAIYSLEAMPFRLVIAVPEDSPHPLFSWLTDRRLPVPPADKLEIALLNNGLLTAAKDLLKTLQEINRQRPSKHA